MPSKTYVILRSAQRPRLEGRTTRMQRQKRSARLQRAGIARQVDEFQHRAVGIKEIGARPVDDPALAVFFEGDLDPAGAQMVERGLVILVRDGEGMMDTTMAFGHRVDRRVALDEDEASPGGIEEGH